MGAGKAAKVLRRTLSGGALVACVAGLVAWNHHQGSGRPLYWTSAVVLIAAVVEAARMGSLALLGLRPPLLLAAVTALLLTDRAIEGAELAAEYAGWPAAVSGAYHPDYALQALLCLAVAFAAHGLARTIARIVRQPDVARLLALALVGGVVLWALSDGAEARSNAGAAALLLGLVALVTAPLAWLEPGGRERTYFLGLLSLWLVPPLAALWSVWHERGTGGLVALLVLSKIGDTAGYYVGSSIGRTHPFPRISPGKTVAGCVASFTAATAVGGVLQLAGVLPDGPLGVLGGCAAGALLNLAAQSGDLLESWLKRRAGVKDSSNWFGPSGGLLDQLDSLLLSIPAALLAWPWLFGH
jgi:CDP-diglyceride synthetase